jgi:membrane fusion protein, multidrug efflux system
MSSHPAFDPPENITGSTTRQVVLGETSNKGSIGPELIAPSPTPMPKRSWLYRIASSIVLLSVAGGLYWSREQWQPIVDGWIRPAGKSSRPEPRPPLVTAAIVERQAVSQFINCLGTVTAFNNVVVRSRVDGELIEVLFEEGKMVHAGQVMAKVDPRIFEAARDQANGQLQRDLAAFELAKLSFERAQNLAAGDNLSEQERDQLEAGYKQAQAVVEVDRATLSNAELQLEYCTIQAPISGRVGLRVLDQGNMVAANDPRGLAVIAQLQPISILFPIPQDEIPRVQKQLATSATVPVFAYDRSFQNLLAEGNLTAIDNQVDPTTGTLRLKANFENSDGSLFPNQFVNVRLLVRRWEDAMVVPSSAVQRGADFLYVYVVQEDSTVDLARVTVAFSEGRKTVIETGLEPGQRVVTDGTDKLQPKAKVSLLGEAKR